MNTKHLAERLRHECEHDLHFETSQLLREAADQIEALSKELESVRDKLESLYDESTPLAHLMKDAQAIVEAKHVFKKFIRGTPLENDVAVWMAEFAKEAISKEAP